MKPDPAPVPAPRRAAANDDIPRPPGSIPGAGPAPQRQAPAAQQQQQRNLFDRMFGG